MSMGMKTPLGRVRGMGSAKSGTEHFWHQRLTGVLMVPLTIGFVLLVICLLQSDYAGARAILASPFAGIVLFLFVVTGAIHMRLGMQVIIEDYVISENLKFAAVIGNTIFCLLIGAISVYALLKLNFGI